MRNATRLMLGTASLSIVLALGCGRSNEAGYDTNQNAAEQAAETAGQATENAAESAGNAVENAAGEATASMQAHMQISDLEIGKTLDADGTVENEEDNFRAGETIYISADVHDVPAGGSVEAVWMGPNDTRIDSEVKTVTEGQENLSFQAPDTSTWTAGDYTVELRVGNEVGGTEHFEIEGAQNG